MTKPLPRSLVWQALESVAALVWIVHFHLFGFAIDFAVIHFSSFKVSILFLSTQSFLLFFFGPQGVGDDTLTPFITTIFATVLAVASVVLAILM
jgi:hypothetical protein